MKHRIVAWSAIVLVVGLSPLVATPARCQAELLHDEAGGLFDVSAYKKLALDGIQGTVVLRLGKPGELRYASRILANRRDELPVALWGEGSTLIIAPYDEEEPQRLFLEITIPPGLDVDVDIHDSVVHASGLQSEFVLDGTDVELHASGLAEDVELNVKGGSVEVGANGGALELDGSGLEVKLSFMNGPVALTLVGSTVEMSDLRRGAQLTLRETALVVRSMQGRLQVQSEGGRIEVASARQGAILDLEETPVSMVDVEGGVQIETDGEVRFREMKSEMVIHSYGGDVRGYGNTGAVELRSESAVVHLEQIQSAVTVEGQDLRVQLKELRGTAMVNTSMSEVHVVDADAGIEIDNDFGNIVINKVAGGAKVSSRDGDVRISELKGQLELNADGPHVEVSWVELGGEGDSTVLNASGNVVLALPANGSCRVDAQAEFGRIDSGLDEIQVSDDGRKAAGSLGRAETPTLKIRSGGQLSIRRYQPPRGQ